MFPDTCIWAPEKRGCPEFAIRCGGPYSERGSLPPLSDLLSATVRYSGIPTVILESLLCEKDVRRSGVFLNPFLILDFLLLWKENGSYCVADDEGEAADSVLKGLDVDLPIDTGPDSGASNPNLS